jgi:hypothetical protein
MHAKNRLRKTDVLDKLAAQLHFVQRPGSRLLFPRWRDSQAQRPPLLPRQLVVSVHLFSSGSRWRSLADGPMTSTDSLCELGHVSFA